MEAIKHGGERRNKFLQAVDQEFRECDEQIEMPKQSTIDEKWTGLISAIRRHGLNHVQKSEHDSKKEIINEKTFLLQARSNIRIKYETLAVLLPCGRVRSGDGG